MKGLRKEMLFNTLECYLVHYACEAIPKDFAGTRGELWEHIEMLSGSLGLGQDFLVAARVVCSM